MWPTRENDDNRNGNDDTTTDSFSTVTAVKSVPPIGDRESPKSTEQDTKVLLLEHSSVPRLVLQDNMYATGLEKATSTKPTIASGMANEDINTTGSCFAVVRQSFSSSSDESQYQTTKSDTHPDSNAFSGTPCQSAQGGQIPGFITVLVTDQDLTKHPFKTSSDEISKPLGNETNNQYTTESNPNILPIESPSPLNAIQLQGPNSFAVVQPTSYHSPQVGGIPAIQNYINTNFTAILPNLSSGNVLNDFSVRQNVINEQNTDTSSTVKNDSLICQICHQTFVRNSNLRRHMLSVHLKRRWQCPKCIKYYSRSDGLDRHMFEQHE